MAPRLLLALLAILPGGCSGGWEDDAAALQRTFAEARAGLLLAGTGAVMPAAPRMPWPGAAMATPHGRPAASGPRPTAATELLGARPDTVRRWLGEPALRRAEGTAEVWLYAGPGCALDLVLYPEHGGLRAWK